ncbi:MAG TPA: transglutaminase, partial [Chryseobacterium sp.]
MRKIIILSLLLFVNATILAQKQEFLKIPKFNKDDLKKEKSAIDAKAPAEILYRSIHYRIDNSSGNLIKKYAYRVKIYDKEKTEDWHNLEVSLFDNNSGERELLNNMKAFVYNLEGDNVQETKVDKSSKFKSKENKYYNINKYAFPNIKNGSVIEYQYEVTSPFVYEIPLIYIELDTPSVYTEYVFDTPIQMSYSVDFTGSLIPKYKIMKEDMMYGVQY